MTTLHLVCHGETIWNEQDRLQGWSDSPLTSKGRYRTSLLSMDFRSRTPAAVYSSPSECALQSARILVAGVGLDVRVSEALREIHFGDWEGRRLADIAEEDPVGYRDFQERPERFSASGGESFQDLCNRLIPFIGNLLSTHAGGEILLVSHFAAIKLLMGFFEGKPLERLWEPPLPHPGAHSTVESSGDGRFAILRYADQAWPMAHPKREPVAA